MCHFGETGRMEHRAFQLLFILGMLSVVQLQSWTTHCGGGPCPEYHVVQNHGDFEEREYVRTRWITTKVQSSSTFDLMTAHQTLKSYAGGHNKAGTTVSSKTWPVLINVTVGEDGSERDIFLSWFVTDDTELPEALDSSVTEEVKPAATVYVREFNERVTLENGKYNAEQLRDSLEKAGKSFEPSKYTGAGYNGLLDINQHNEVWVYAV